MRLIVLATALLALGACSPREKPADIASPADASAASSAAYTLSFHSDQSWSGSASMFASFSVGDSGKPGTCKATIGDAAAQKLVDRCIAVSPATHPPCNAENTCEMIQGEIDRSCAMYGAGETKPAECTG